MVEVNLEILNLLDWLVGGEGGKHGDSGGHLPLIDLLKLGLVLSVREGGAGRPDRANLDSSQTCSW